MRGLLGRLGLEVVHRQPLVRGPDESLEEEPRSARESTQLSVDRRPGSASWRAGGGRLTQRAISGARNQMASSGKAKAIDAGRTHATSMAMASARAGDEYISRQKNARGDFNPIPNVVCAADVHSSRCLRVIDIRTTTRTTASTTSAASCAREDYAKRQDVPGEALGAPPAVAREGGRQRNREHGERGERPRRRLPWKPSPARYEEIEKRRARETPPEVVGDLPSIR